MYLYNINTTLALICLIANVFSYCNLVRVTYKLKKLITKTFNSEEIELWRNNRLNNCQKILYNIIPRQNSYYQEINNNRNHTSSKIR